MASAVHSTCRASLKKVYTHAIFACIRGYSGERGLTVSGKKMSPVLKWAGGKTQIVECISARMPAVYNAYYEPFIGGAAVLLRTAPEHAFVNDVNGQLINLYTQLKFSVESVIEHVKALDSRSCTKEFYYAVRKQYNRKIARRDFDAECAALMLWINKHCFNGLYRVNRKGLFNVPFNNKIRGKSFDEGNVRAVSAYLRTADVTLTCLDFETACAGVLSGDFVYFDSPYVPESVTASFTSYTHCGFTLAEHKRLAALFRRLDGRGAKLMLSNNDVPFVRSLYKGYNIVSINVKRLINRDAGRRSGREVLITNYCCENG